MQQIPGSLRKLRLAVAGIGEAAAADEIITDGKAMEMNGLRRLNNFLAEIVLKKLYCNFVSLQSETR